MAEGLDHLVRKEFLNGEISGIRLFMNFPDIVIEDLGSQLDEIQEQLKDG